MVEARPSLEAVAKAFAAPVQLACSLAVAQVYLYTVEVAAEEYRPRMLSVDLLPAVGNILAGSKLPDLALPAAPKQ